MDIWLDVIMKLLLDSASTYIQQEHGEFYDFLRFRSRGNIITRGLKVEHTNIIYTFDSGIIWIGTNVPLNIFPLLLPRLGLL